MCTEDVAVTKNSFACASNASEDECTSLTSNPWRPCCTAVKRLGSEDRGTWVFSSNSTTYWL